MELFDIVEVINLDKYSYILVFENDTKWYVDGHKVLDHFGRRHDMIEHNYLDNSTQRQARQRDITDIPQIVMSNFGWDERFGVI